MLYRKWYYNYSYEICGTCYEKVDENDNKCTECIYNHTSGKYVTHFIGNTSNCVPEENQSNKTFLDEDDNIYKECYERRYEL